MKAELYNLGSLIEADMRANSLKEYIQEQKGKISKAVFEIVPGLSFFKKFQELYISIQDYFLMEKVCIFLFELASMSPESRIHLIDKINTDPIYSQKFGTFLILAIDRHDFQEKSGMLARVCKYYEAGHLSKSTFIRFKGLIEELNIEDLSNLHYEGSDYVGYPTKKDDISLYKFQSLGLTRVHTSNEVLNPLPLYHPDSLAELNKIDVILTDFGKVFTMVINDYPDPWYTREGFVL